MKLHRSMLAAATALLLLTTIAQPVPVTLEAEPLRALSSDQGVQLQLDLPPVSWDAGIAGERPIVEGAGSLGMMGGPEIPVYSRLVAVPHGMELRVADMSLQWGPVERRPLALDPGHLPDGKKNYVGLQRNSAAFAEAAALTEQVVRISETKRWRDIRLARVDIFPVKVNAEGSSARSLTSLDLELEFVPTQHTDSDDDPPGMSEAMLPLYRQFVVNTIPELDDPANLQRGSYLILVPDAWISAIQPLAEWRTRNGYHVQVAPLSQVGDATNENTVKAFIDNIYQTADPALEYVLLVGDSDQPSAGGDVDIQTWHIPSGSTYPATASDQKYTYDITGDGSFENVLPRFFIGRLSVDTATELTTIVAKILQYERDPLVGNQDRWRRAVLAADVSFAISTMQTQLWVGDQLSNAGFNRVYTSFADPSDQPLEVMLTPINQGVSWVSYRGFGNYSYWTGSFPIFDIDVIQTQVTNADNLPVITSMVCGGGAWDKRDLNFGESWIRTGTPNNLKGAVAFIGPSELDTHTRWNNMMLAGWYQSMLHHDLRTMGQCMVGAKILLRNNYPLLWNAFGGNSNSVWYYFHTYNILGDPALQLRVGPPRIVEAVYNDTLRPNDTHFAATVTDTFGVALENARVTLTLGDSLLASGAVAASGALDLPLSGLSSLPAASEIYLTITRPDLVPLLDTLVFGDAAGLSLDALNFVEASEPDPQTNGDGSINPGELVFPDASFTVAQPGGLTNASIEISLPEGGASTVTASENLGNIDEGALVHPASLRLRIDIDAGPDRRLPLLFTVTADGLSPQVHRATLPAMVAPRLVLTDIDYSTEWRPGRTADLSMTLVNNHPTLAAGPTSGVLRVEDSMVTLVDSTISWDDVPADSMPAISGNDSLVLTIDSNAYPGRSIPAELMLTTQQGYVEHLPLTLTVAGSDPFTPTGPSGPGYFIYEDVDTGYEHSPDFAYESILGQPGTSSLNLSDYGNNQDDVTVVDLPFSFPYWDTIYDEISVCSNGWFSFGRTDLFFFRNRPLPGPLTPLAGVLVWWDDLIFPPSGAGVYTQYDEANGWYTIEWYNVQHYSAFPNGPMRFQARIYDPAVHGAPSGYGMIALNYDTVLNSDASENYATVGITGPTGVEAIQYEFADSPAATALGVVDGRQLLIAVSETVNLAPPDLAVVESSVSFSVPNGGASARRIHIRNNGERALRYHLLPEGIIAPDDSGNLDEEGGPDSFGYRWYDSREDYGPPVDWIDIAQPENELTLNEGNDQGQASVSSAIDLPFSFPFYGELYDRLWVCESGYISFVDPGAAGNSINTQLPISYAPHSAIFPFWDNIGTDEGGGIYMDSTRERVIISFEGLHHLHWEEEDGPYNFQLKLTPDGGMEIQYGEMNPRLGSATVGLQNLTADTGLQIGLNESTADLLASNLALRIVPDLPWLSLFPATGSIAGGEMAEVELLADAIHLDSGLHEGRLVVYAPFTGQSHLIGIELFVSGAGDGFPPQVHEMPSIYAPAGQSFRPLVLDPYVEDWDNRDDELQWDVIDGDGMLVSISDQHLLSVTPDAGFDGSASVILRVTDPQQNIGQTAIHYVQGTQNNAPFFDVASPDALGILQLDQGQSSIDVPMQVAVSDVEGDELSLEWLHQGDVVATGSSTTIHFDRVGADSVHIVATDAQGASFTLLYTTELQLYSAAPHDEALPTHFALETVYPNPFNASLSVRYALPRASRVELKIFNLLGREVASLQPGLLAAGRHSVSFDASSWASGIYFLRWRAGDQASATRKLVLVK